MIRMSGRGYSNEVDMNCGLYKPSPAFKRLAKMIRRPLAIEANKAKNCPLCTIDLNKEKVFWEVPAFVIMRTKDLKGHRERIMIVYKAHRHEIPYEAYEAALDALIKIGKKVFKYAPKFVIMDSTFATINEHWHLVATDLDPKAVDFDQILKTKWIKVIDPNWD